MHADPEHVMDLDEALDKLYAVPLADFTSTRNAYAAQLTKEGDAAGGAQVKALKKPNLAAWTLNQFVRAHPDELAALVDATDRVRKSHRRALSGGKAADLREATDMRNKIANNLTKLAAAILTGAGSAAAASTLAAINDSFMAIASDDVGGELLKRGRLTRELKPGAIADVGALTLVPADDGDEVSSGEEPDLTAVQAARDVVAEARRKVTAALAAIKEADAEAWRVQGEADEAERKAKAAAESAEFAKRAADARRAEAEEAQKALDAAQAALKEAESPG